MIMNNSLIFVNELVAAINVFLFTACPFSGCSGGIQPLRIEQGMERAAQYVESEVVKSISTGQEVRRTKTGRLVGLNPSTLPDPRKIRAFRARKAGNPWREGITHRRLAG